MENTSTFIYLYDTIENFEGDLINTDDVFSIDDDLYFLFDGLKLLEQKPSKEIVENILSSINCK